ncbi:hypothetical protein ACHAXS_000450 [Conticribra weissflogii]
MTNQAKIFALLSHHLANTNTNVSQWDSNAPLTLPSKSWNKSYVTLMTPVFMLTILVLFFHLGTPSIASQQNSTLVGGQWLHHQSAQMQMGHPQNRLAWRLAETHWPQAMAYKS